MSMTFLGKVKLWQPFDFSGASPMAQWVKNLPAMQETQETWVQSLGQEDPLEKEWQPTSVFLPGKSHAQRRLVGYSPQGRRQ